MAVRITTLGTFRVERDGQTLDRLPAARNRSALLVHLAMEREVTREAVMGLLWPDRPPDRARHLLSQTLYELRQELGESWMETAGERIRATDEVEVDALELEAALDEGRPCQAVELYGGRFLPGAALAVSRPMEGWIDSQQARLVRLHRRARREAMDAHVAGGDLAEALAVARAWVELDPLDDEGQHRLIELLAASGDRSGALRQYDRYARLVDQELELEPLEETRELVERIRNGDVGERQTSRVAEPRPEYAAAPAGAPTGVPTPTPSPSPGGPGETSGERRGSGAPSPARTDSRLDRFLDSLAGLRHRRTVQWTLAYLAGAVVLLEGMDVVTDAFGLSGTYLRVLSLLLALGAIVVLGAGWYMSSEGRRFGRPEAALTLLVGTFVLSLPVWFARAMPTPTAAEAALPPNRLAVLHFDDMSPDGSLGALSAGFTDALIHELSKVEGLEVLSRRAVAPFRENQTLSYDSLVNALGAGILVEGSVTTVGDSIRLTIQLISGASASNLMSTVLQSPRDSVDQLLAAMPEEAARLLRRRLGDWVRLKAMETAASSARALELVQRVEPLIEDARAVGQANQAASLSLLARADSMLAEAEAEDPGWPGPIMMRAEVASIEALATAAVPSQYEPGATRRAFSHLERLLRRWPDYAPALAMRGNLRFGLGQTGSAPEEELLTLYEQAEADLRKSVLLDENLTEGWWGLSKMLLHLNAYAEALQAAVRAMETDSFLATDWENLLHLFWVTFNAEDHPAALHWCDEIRDRYPGSGNALYCELFLLTTSPIISPDVERAWEIRDQIVGQAAAADKDVYRGYIGVQVAKVILRTGDTDSTRAVLARSVPDPMPDWAVYDVAHLRLLLGEEDRALDVLERWFEWNPVRAQRLARDWWFRRLHGHPRFEALVGSDPG